MAGVIAILRKALERIAMGGASMEGRFSQAAMSAIAATALEDAARLSQDCLRAQQQDPTPCEDGQVQYSGMCD